MRRRRRAERALTTVVATCYLLGVSTRRMEKLVESLGITDLSMSQFSDMAKDLDDHVAQFRTRPLDGRALHVRRRRRPGLEGARGRPRRRDPRPGGHRGQRRRAPGDPGAADQLRRGRRQVAHLLPRPDRPRPVRGRPGHLRCPPRAGHRDRRHPARGQLATLPHPLRSEPDGRHPESVLGVGQGAAALGLRPARRRRRHPPSTTGSRRRHRQAARRR